MIIALTSLILSYASLLANEAGRSRDDLRDLRGINTVLVLFWLATSLYRFGVSGWAIQV
jgi:hypothetical protein